LRFADRTPRPTVIPQPSPPAHANPAPVTFDLDYHFGTFHLSLAYALTENRLAVLGPSGAGKSALLRSLAGLHGADPGPVFYGDHAVQHLALEDRRVGYVAQGFSLFPHLTVWQQLLFPKGATAETASYWLQHLHLDGLEDRYPRQLSGGQRQRVGLAQALCRSPGVLLLDEPFSALDAPVRRELRRELLRLQRETGLTTVLVTHDPEDAAYLADEVIVMAQGSSLQTGATRQVFSRPSSPEVARLLGIPNLHRAVVVSDDTLDVQGLLLQADANGLTPGTEVWWSVRPDHIRLAPGASLSATVLECVDVGTSTEVLVSLGDDIELELRTPDPVEAPVGGTCRLEIPGASISVWPTAVHPAHASS